ncbi:hypothetical protein RUM43_012377 [Polyplax serrata]|uniref:FUN14 domain-containing protein 1 n=1 Tax=Polyplax serrata TaxID=468196 RepID=A0AAN8NX56_POLSC
MKFGRKLANRKERKIAESKLGFLKFWCSSNKKKRECMTFSKPPDKDMTNNKKSIVDEILGDLSKSSAIKQIALGTTSGWLTGYVTMKAGKLAAIAIGGGILILQIAQHKGYININWDKIYKTTDKMIDKFEKEATGKGPDMMDKVTRYVDRKLDKAEDMLKSNERKARRWYHTFINNNGHGGYQLQELHLFMASFAAGVTFGFATA